MRKNKSPHTEGLELHRPPLCVTKHHQTNNVAPRQFLQKKKAENTMVFWTPTNERVAERVDKRDRVSVKYTKGVFSSRVRLDRI